MGSSAAEEADGGGYVVDGSTGPDVLARAAAMLASVTHLLLSKLRFNPEEGRQRRKSNDEFQTKTRKRHSEDPRAEKVDGNKRARRTVDKTVKSAKRGLIEIDSFECENCESSFATETALKTHKNSCAGAHLVDLPTSQTPSKRKGKTRFPCKQCKVGYSTKSNLARHVKRTHLGKKPEEVLATKVVSNKNKNEKNTFKAEAKCEKFKCVFCDKELTSIYRHYGNRHNIDNLEQLLFVDGNVLVISDIDTKGGKAPWFLREAEKAKRYTPNTICRLCETEYDDPAVLEKHYCSDHKVVPGSLERLKILFRAKKGAHLADLPASRAPSKQQKSTLRPPQGEPLSRGLVKDTNGYVSAAEHNNQKSEQEIEKQDAPTNITWQNIQNDSQITENSTARLEQGSRQPIQILEDTIISQFCNVCKKSIMNSYFEAHAATHKYVAVEADYTQSLKANATKEQRSSPAKEHEQSQYDHRETVEGNCDGTVEPWNSDNDSCHSLRSSSDVVQVDMHVEGEETEEINHSHQSDSSRSNNNVENCDKAKTAIETSAISTDSNYQDEQNSETNYSIAIHQSQDTEGLEERDAFSKGLKEDLEHSLQVVLGDGENDTYVNKLTSDNCYTSAQLRDIVLETNTTGQETSEMHNDHGQVHAGIQNNNDEFVVHSRNDADANISQDIFTGEPSEIHRENSEICELSQDMFSGTIQSQEHVVIADNTNDINKSNANETTSESGQGNDGHMQPNPRQSTRDIIRSLLEDTTSGFKADTEEERRNEEKGKTDQQSLINETQRIKDIMFSRD